MGFASSGLKRCRSSSMSSSMECINEIQHPDPNLKKQKVDNRWSFPSSLGKEASEVKGEKKGGGGVGFSDSKAARVETLKKRFGRIIVKAAEFQVEDRRSDHQKVDPVEIQRKNQILEKKLKEAEIVAEAELKMELQRKREEAKKALLELERSISVEIDDNASTMKDFAVMLGYPRNCAVCLCNEIGWYGAPVMVHSKRRTAS